VKYDASALLVGKFTDQILQFDLWTLCSVLLTEEYDIDVSYCSVQNLVPLSYCN